MLSFWVFLLAMEMEASRKTKSGIASFLCTKQCIYQEHSEWEDFSFSMKIGNQ